MRIIAEIMSRREAATTRRPELREAQCLIIENTRPDGKKYWRRLNGMPDGYTDELQEAGIYVLSEAVSLTPSSYGDYSIALITEGVPEPGPDGKPRLRMAKLVLGHSLYAMVEVSPNNPVVRAHIMAKCGEMPKDELDTMQKLIDWIECDLKLSKKAAPTASATSPRPPIGVRVTPALAFIVQTSNQELEQGTCRYSRTENSISRVPITEERIEELLDEDSDYDLEEIIDYLVDEIDDAAGNHAEGREYTNEETDQHEPNEGDGMETDFSRVEIKRNLVEYLRRTQTAETLQALGINE